MPRTFLIAIASSVVLAAALGWAGQQRRLGRGFAQAHTALQRERETLAPRRSEARTAPGDGRRRSEEPPAAAAAVDEAVRPATGIQNPWDLAKPFPELQALRLAAARARIELAYAPLFRRLKLSTEQAAQFCQLLIRREEQQADVAAAAAVQGLAEEDVAVRPFAKGAKHEFEEARRASLGEAGAREALEFERVLPVRNGVAEIAATAVQAGVPLTSAQTERLLEVVLAAADRYHDGTPNLEHADWAMIDRQAREILTPGQFAVFSMVEAQPVSRFSGPLHAAIDRARRAEAQQLDGVRQGGRR